MPLHWSARAGLGLALATAPVPALASQWWYVNSGAGRVVFVDAKSIDRRKDIVTYWSMYVIRPGDPEVMTKAHMRADCRRRRLGFLQVFRYDAAGRLIGDAAHAPPSPMQSVAPDTLGDAEMHFACGSDGDRVANDQFEMAVDEVKFAEALVAHGDKSAEAHALHDAMAGRLAAPASADPPPAIVAVAEPGDDAADKAELYEKACAEGDADSCTSLGMLYEKGDGVEKSATRAAAAFAQACDKGGASRCGNIGLAYVSGDGVSKDVARAFGYFAAACDAGNAGACSALGASYSTGTGVKADPQRARALFKRACDGDDAGGCYNLGVVYDQGLGVKADPARAVPLYMRACDGDDGSACANLGSLVQDGRGVAKDAARAATLFAKACTLDDAEGCLNLGRVYQAGAGVARDPGKAAQAYRHALAIEPGMADARRALAGIAP